MPQRWRPNFMKGHFSRLFSELAVQTAGEHRDRSPIGVIGRICDELIIGGEREVLVNRVSVVGLKASFGAVVELAVADQETEASGSRKCAVCAGEAVNVPADADCVAWAPPIAALDRQAS